MTTIHENNCEAFFLDYYEGRLDNAQTQLLFNFLRENPSWKAVFEEYGEVPDSDVALFEHTATSISNAELPAKRDEEEDLIALLEGQLNDRDARALRDKIERDTAVASDFRMYELTRLEPDLNVVFPDKKELKRGAPVLSLFARYSSVAALMAGAFIAVWIFSKQENTINMAEYTPRERGEVGSEKETVFQSTEESSVPELNSVTDQSFAKDLSPIQTSEKIKTSETTKDNPYTAQTTNVGDAPSEGSDGIRQRVDRVELETMSIKSDADKLLAVLNVEEKQLIKTASPDPLPKPKPTQPTVVNDESIRGLFGAFLSDIGQSVVERVKAATDDEVVIEKDENTEDELVTSTFKLGAFEVYRSRAKK